MISESSHGHFPLSLKDSDIEAGYSIALLCRFQNLTAFLHSFSLPLVPAGSDSAGIIPPLFLASAEMADSIHG